MASNSHTPTLPTINLEPFLNPKSSPEVRSSTAHAIDRACTEYGFFYLIGHGIPETTTDKVLRLARAFFSRPNEEKEKIARSRDGFRGYQGLGENITLNSRDMQEAIDLYCERRTSAGPPNEAVPGSNLWPEEPKEMRVFYEAYIEETLKVGGALVKAMGVALDLGPVSTDSNSDTSTEDEDVLVRNSNKSFWIMRLIGYPQLAKPLSEKNDIAEYSCGEHSDYGCVTLLLTDDTKGALQVKLRDGSYLNIDPVPGAFVVNIGDMIERWTNGLWHSVRHRVIHRGDGYRVSVPFFFEPNFNAVVKPLRKCVQRTGGEAKFEPVKYGDHLMGKLHNNFYNGGN